MRETGYSAVVGGRKRTQRHDRFPGLLLTVRRVGEVLETAVEPQQAAWAALVALTAGEGFGFNRAFLLVARNRQLLGWFGVGPRNRDEAIALWSDIERAGTPPLGTVHDPDPALLSREESRHRDTLARLTTSLPCDAFDWRRPQVARPGHPVRCIAWWLSVLGSAELAVLPVTAKSGPWGVVLADNFVTGAPIDSPVLDAAETLVRGLRAALDRAWLLASLQEERRHRTLAEQATSLLEAARTLAHDLKNPLTIAGGMARELLVSRPDDPEALRRSLKVVIRAVDRAEARVADLVEGLVRQAAPVNLQPVEVGALADQVVNTFRPLATSRGLRLACYHPRRPLMAAAHPDYLERCLENLIGNAIETSRGPGGQIEVAAKEDGSEVVLEVADDGPPLPPLLRSNPFAGGVSSRGSGTGLGLVSVQRLAEAMGGRVEYDENQVGWVRFAVAVRRWR